MAPHPVVPAEPGRRRAAPETAAGPASAAASAAASTTASAPASAPASASDPAAASAAARADPSFPRLVADIGGTNARFAWLAAPGAPLSQLRQLAVRDFAGPAEAALAYLADLQGPPPARLGSASGGGGGGVGQDLGWPHPRHAALAVATAANQDRVRFTNSPWDFSRQALQQALGLDSLLLLNDFEALALSLPTLTDAQRRGHGAAAPQARGTLAVVGPGTGLGVGAVVATPCGWVALPGEGGHATLAPADALESALLAALRSQHAHVSAERLLSGIGLPLLHQGLGQVLGRPVGQAWSTRAIVAEGAQGGDALASQTLDLFCAMLGGFAGNVALTVGARSGLYIGGGLVPRFAERFFASAFRDRFEAKGRLRPYLAAIPTALITDTLAALAGAALAIEQQLAARAR